MAAIFEIKDQGDQHEYLGIIISKSKDGTMIM